MYSDPSKIPNEMQVKRTKGGGRGRGWREEGRDVWKGVEEGRKGVTEREGGGSEEESEGERCQGQERGREKGRERRRELEGGRTGEDEK